MKPFYEAVWRKPPSGFATEADCAVRVRLGDLIQGKPYGDALDQWWVLEPSASDSGEIGKEIEEALKESGIPFLEQFDSFGKIAKHLQKVEGWQAKNPLITLYRALAEWKTGDSRNARETLAMIKGKAWEARADVVRKVVENA